MHNDVSKYQVQLFLRNKTTCLALNWLLADVPFTFVHYRMKRVGLWKLDWIFFSEVVGVVSLLPVLAKIKKNEEGFLVHIYLVPTTVP
jgi:hypothetical protein